MGSDPIEWTHCSPADEAIVFGTLRAGDVDECVRRAKNAFPAWAARSFEQRWECLCACREALENGREALAQLITQETGKPIFEARLEMGAVIAKFDFTHADGVRYILEEAITDGPHAAQTRWRARGTAAVIAPFNFPIHLGHGATIAHLLAGNTVVFKPSPLASHVGLAYAEMMQANLPGDVFQSVLGWGEVGRALCLHADVRSVCFTGSIPVGRSLAQALAPDYSKSLALELGGKNSLIVCEDADIPLAARATADGLCLTAGQRCNATARVLVHARVEAGFLRELELELARYTPGNPSLETTALGPLISSASRVRYQELLATTPGEPIFAGSEVARLATGEAGFYVTPAVLRAGDVAALDASAFALRESFVPILVVETFDRHDEAVARHEAWDFGLSASIFTASDENFHRLGDRLHVGNLYKNLPTTFSPSTLPFGGWGRSGNGHPGSRGFIRFCCEEQAVQRRS